MPYIGKTPSQATRARYYLTASGSETSISGSMTTGGTLTFTDGNFVDVSVNGVALVAGTDYNTNTANTIAGLTALTANDQVEIIVYDTFSVFSGDVDSDFSVGGNLSVTGTTALTGVVTANAGVVVDNITIDGTEIDLSSGDLTIDVAGDITLDADGADIILADGGTTFLEIDKDGNNSRIKNPISDGDIKFQGNDGGSIITALDLDMSDNGAATLSNGLTLTDGDLVVASGHGISFAATSDASGMTSELLDDYEEGTFTPSYTQGTDSATYSIQTGRYTKVGNRVFFEFELDGNSITGNSSHLYIGGLPFTSKNAVPSSGALISYTGGVSNNIHVTGVIFNNGTVIGVYKFQDGGSVAGNTMALNGGWRWFGHYDVN